MSQEPRPQREAELQPDRATSDHPPSHGPGTSGLAGPGSADDEVTLVLRHEPDGPTTTLSVTRHTTFAEVRRLGMAKFNLVPGTATKYLLVKSGWIVDTELTVGDMHLHELDFFSLGLKDDVYLAEEQLRMLM